MNERIRELAEQAGFNVPASEQQHNGQILRNSLERFAELIVKECADIVQFLQDHGREDIADDLKKHFGVE